MTNKFLQIYQKVIGGDPDQKHIELMEQIVIECSSVLQAHAEGFERYNMTIKASEAFVCSKIILEHFNLTLINDEEYEKSI